MMLALQGHSDLQSRGWKEAESVCSLAIGPLQGWTSGLPLLVHRLYPEDRRSMQGQEYRRAAMSQFPQTFPVEETVMAYCLLVI